MASVDRRPWEMAASALVYTVVAGTGESVQIPLGKLLLALQHIRENFVSFEHQSGPGEADDRRRPFMSSESSHSGLQHPYRAREKRKRDTGLEAHDSAKRGEETALVSH